MFGAFGRERPWGLRLFESLACVVERCMTDLERHVRKVSRALGVEVTILYRDNPRKEPVALLCIDAEQYDRLFERDLGTPSNWERNLKIFHETIYHARGVRKYHQQKGLCAICGESLNGGTQNTEIDHIESRGAHGRDDRLSNLRVVHGDPCHRERHNPTTRRIGCQN